MSYVTMAPLWLAFAQDRLLLVAFCSLALTSLAPTFVTPFLPLTDLGFHGHAGLLPDLLLGDPFLNEWYAINWRPMPYWSAYALQSAFSLLFGPTLAVKIVAGLVVVLLPLAAMRLAIALGRDPRIALLVFALVWDKNVYWGWLAFQFGMGLCLWALARLVECQTWRQAFWLWPLTALVGLTQPHPIALLAVAGGLIAISGRPLVPMLLRRAVALAGTLLTVVPWLLSTFFSTRTANPAPLLFNDAPLAEKVSSLYKYSLDNYVAPGDQRLAVLAFVAVLFAPVLLAALPAKTVDQSRNRLLAPMALFIGSMCLYLLSPFEFYGSIVHWWTYPRFATYILIGALLVPRPDLSKLRGLYLVPWLLATLSVHFITTRQFLAFGQSVKPLLEIQHALPEHKRLYPISFETGLPSVQGFVVISLHGYLAMEKKAYDPHMFDIPHIPVRYKKRLAQHHWPNPYTFRFDQHAKDYDYVLIYPSRRDPLQAAVRERKVELVKESGPWRLYRVTR